MPEKHPAAVALGMRRWANRTPHPCANGCGRQTIRAYCSPACKQQAYRRNQRSPAQKQLDELAAGLGISHTEALRVAIKDAHAKYLEP